MSRREAKPCPLCGAEPLAVSRHGDRDAFDIECRRCGRFTVSGTLYAISRIPEELKPRLSAYTRQCQEEGRYPEMLTTSNMESLAESRAKTAPSEKLNKLLAVLAGRSDHPGARTSFDTEWDYPLIDAKNREEADFHLLELKKRGFIELPTFGTIMVTHEGWDHVRGGAVTVPASPPVSEGGPAQGMEWDAFVCHASEDKEMVAEPLVSALAARGLRVWYDRAVLTIGDSLRRKIDDGLAQSRFGIVILSPAFFGKEWPQRELDGLVQKEILGRKVILPVWHGVTHTAVAQYSLPLADRVAGSTVGGIEPLADELVRAIKAGETEPSATTPADPSEPPRTEDKWVDFEYPKSSGLVERLEKEGYRVRWCMDSKLARALDLEGWEPAHQDLGGGRRAILKLRDRPENQTLIKKRQA